MLLGVIRQFRTANFTVVADAVEEQDLDLSWDETGEVARKIANGDLLVFCARVRVFHEDCDAPLATTTLGNCVYESFADFATPGGYLKDMVQEACQSARARLVSWRTMIKGLRIRQGVQS